MLLLVGLMLLIGLLLRTTGFQTFLASKAAAYLSGQLGTEISIGKLSLHSWQDAELMDLFVQDFHGDTLLFAKFLSVEGFTWNGRESHLNIDRLELLGSRHNLRRYLDRDSTDLSILLSKLQSDSKPESDVLITVGKYLVRDHTFTFNDDHSPFRESGIDFKHLSVVQEVLKGEKLRVDVDTISMELDSLVLWEQSGFRIRQMAAAAHISPTTISLSEMQLRGSRSVLIGDLSFNQESYSDFKDFVRNVYVKARLDDSNLHFGDLSPFAPNIAVQELDLRLSGRFRGPLSDIKGRDVELTAGSRTTLTGDFDLSGLPSVKSTFMIIDVDRFTTDRSDLASLPIPSVMDDPDRIVPRFLSRFGRMGFSGNFTGFVNAFTAFGTFTSDLGSINSDVTLTRDTVTGFAVIDGKVETSVFELGQAVGRENFGTISAKMDIVGKGADFQNFKAQMDGTVPHLVFSDRKIENIVVKGELADRVFNGFLTCDDEDFQFDFNGLADLTGKWPQLDFEAFVEHADPYALGFHNFPPGGSVSARITAEGLIAPDSLNGQVTVKDVLYCNEDKEYYFKDATLTSSKVQGVPRLEVKSSVLDLTLDGRSVPSEIPLVAQKVMYSVFPSLRSKDDPDLRRQSIRVQVLFKETADVLALVMPDLYIEPGSQFDMKLESETLQLVAELRTDRIGFKDMFVQDLTATVDKTADIVAFDAIASRSAINDSVFIADVRVQGKGYQDDMDVSIGWAGSSRNTSGDLAFQASIEESKKGRLKLLPSELFFGHGTWEIRDTALLTLDSTSIDIQRFEVWNADQLIKLFGRASKDPNEELAFELRGVDLEQVNVFLTGGAFDGIISGTGTVRDPFGETIINVNAGVDSLQVGSDLIGDVQFRGDWNERRKRIDMFGSVSRGVIKAIEFDGWIRPEDNSAIALKLNADRFDLSFLNSYIPKGLSEINGFLTGLIHIDGSLSEPLLNGRARVDDASLKVDFLNTKYSFSTPVTVLPDMFNIDNMLIYDEKGNTGSATISLLHDSFQNFSYDVVVSMESMQCLSTTRQMSDLFYGSAYGTGDVMVSGFGTQMEIEVNARTEKGTHIIFPLGEGKEISSYDFVEFISSDTSTVEAPFDVLGVSMDMKVEVTPDAFIELVFDPTVGDILSGRGSGSIDLSLAPEGDMTMFGDIEVVEGDYLFTLRNLINKRFSIDPGGRVTWFGDPYNAQLDLSAVYKLRAPLYDVLYDASEAFKRRVPVEVVMQLEKNMLNPEIGFDVRLPTVDEGVRTQVNSVLSTEQEMNRQVFSLMVLNKFSAPASGSTEQGFASNSFAGATGSELLSNQVSNWLSGLSDDLDLGVNYRTGNQVAQDELALAVGTQLFNERLRLSTNVGVQYGNRAGAESSSLIGDFELEYLLTQDGKLRVKAFSRSNDQNLNQIDQALSTQGAGIGYRQEFDDWITFWNSIGGVFR